MKAEDQEQMKKLLSEERNQVSPHRDIKTKLDQAFEAKHSQKSIISLWANYPLPAWKVAATVVILIVTGIALGRYKGEQPAPEVIALADTVYIEKIIPGKTDTVIIERVKKEKRKSDLIENTPSVSPTPPVMMNPEMHISDFSDLQPGGRSMDEDSSAQNWVVRIL